MAYSMFGEFFHNIDAKGRLSVPSKFRDSLGSTVVISQGPERCLRLQSLENWEAFVNQLSTDLDTSTTDGRNLFRTITSKASVCEIDSQGRLNLSIRDTLPKPEGYVEEEPRKRENRPNRERRGGFNGNRERRHNNDSDDDSNRKGRRIEF